MTTMTEDEAQLLLARIRRALANKDVTEAEASALRRQMHTLAEFGYAPAIPLFVEGLTDPDPVWRIACLEDLGFHYPVTHVQLYLSQLQALLLGDPDEDVRALTAQFIGKASTWPDMALVKALEHDPEQMVRDACFDALLVQLKAPRLELRTFLSELKGQPHTLEALKAFAKQQGKPLE